MNAYKHLVKSALNAGHVISVFDGEVWEVKKSIDAVAIIECIESVEIAEVVIRNKDGEKIGWALVIPFGVDEDETIADCTMNEYMDSWWESFSALTSE